ncbi:MAG: hypothetical protein ACI4WQ_09505, partial [Sharpea porci]
RSSSKQSDDDLGIIPGILKPVIAEYEKFNDDKRFRFKKTVRNFCKWYGYITTITRMFDRELEEEYIFCQYLDKLLPGIHDPDMVDIEDKLKLEYFKLKDTYDGEIKLEESSKDSELKNPKDVDVSPRIDNIKELNEILDEINSRFNGNFNESDKVMTTALFINIMLEKELKEYAQNNDRQVYVRAIFPEFFEKIAMDCYSNQDGSFKKLYENKDFYNVIMNVIADESFKYFNSNVDSVNVV